MAFNYGGRREIVDSCCCRIAAAGIPLDQVDEQVLSAPMDTADLPDPDLIIRTGGEMRLSKLSPLAVPRMPNTIPPRRSGPISIVPKWTRR